MRKRTFLALSFLLMVPFYCSAQLTAVRFKELIDANGHTIPDAVVIIQGDRIQSISKSNSIPEGSKIIDLSNYTALPGLIDAHTHVTYYWDHKPGTRPWTQLGTLGPAVTVFLAQENAKRTLEAGVTTVRDLGSFDYMDIAMRDLINRGAMIGPRMFVSGYGLYVTSSPYKPGAGPPDGGQADGVAEVDKVVRQQIAAGADCIKMYGSTGSDKDVTGFQTYTLDEMKAAVEIAHHAGKRIAIHSYGPDGAKDAIRAGADSVEHATDMDDATIAEMAKQGTFYVPTVDHNRYYVDHAAEFGYTDEDVQGLREYMKRNFKTLQKAVHAHVNIAMGSDAVFSGNGENTRELEWFVKAGMTPAEAIASATTKGALLLGKEKESGQIAPGFFADIIAVEGNPLQDIRVLIHNVRWVMKGGQVVVDKTH